MYNTVGVKEFKTNSTTGSVLVAYEELEVTKVELLVTLEQTLAEMSLEDFRKEEFLLTGAALSTLSLGLSIGAFVFPVLTPISVPLIIYTALPIYKRAFRAVLQKKIRVDILDAIVIAGCLVTGQIFAAALMVWIVDVGHSMLEGASKQSEVVLLQLFGQRVRFTRILVEGKEERYPVEKLKAGDVAVIYAGEQVPADGVVIEGEGTVDQHIITGESAPVEVAAGAKVFASTLLVAGKIHVRAEDVGENTVEAKVRQIIEQSAKYKVRIQSMGERIADQMVLPTLGLAGLGLATRGTSATLAIINADYGTGIRVAAPVSLLAHLAMAAKRAIIIKKGSALEILPAVDTFIFDKTGTLTREVPEVAEIIPAGGHDEKKVLWYVAAAEQYFTHPIAQSILRKAEELKIQLPKIDKSAYYLGFGIQVTVGGEEIKVGSARFMKREGIEVPVALEERAEIFRTEGGSVIYVSVNGILAGVIGLKSCHRLEAYDVVQLLKKMRKEVILISGDHVEPTRILAGELGISAYYAEILPHQKAGFVKMLQARGKKVAMIGDGVNDGPALSVADVSISLRGASDVAVDAADIVFMDGSLTRFEPLFRISREFQENVNRSWYLILVPNTLCILGALLGVVGLGISLLLNNVFNFVATFNATLPLLAV